MKLFDLAIEYALRKHKGQYRKSIRIPYIVHCMEVAKKVSYYVQDEIILTAAVLHDIIEDCEDYDDMPKIFGTKVFSIVKELSRKKTHTKNHQKWKFMESFHKKSPESILIKMADRCCNTQDFLASYMVGKSSHKQSWPAEYALQARPLIDACETADFDSISGFNDVTFREDISFLNYTVEGMLGWNMWTKEADEFLKNNNYTTKG
jgi:(p)ppGpp synthase/HD superfamily hydrolase